jgi:L-aspartate oxidase
MTHLPGDFLAERFPNIHERCLQLGIDMRSDPIPVVPAAHYMCGGVADRPPTPARAVGGLYAVGEVACTGLHGANRLASNSLLEGVVFAASPPTKSRWPHLNRPARRVRKRCPAWESGMRVRAPTRA